MFTINTNPVVNCYVMHEEARRYEHVASYICCPQKRTGKGYRRKG